MVKVVHRQVCNMMYLLRNKNKYFASCTWCPQPKAMSLLFVKQIGHSYSTTSKNYG